MFITDRQRSAAGWRPRNDAQHAKDRKESGRIEAENPQPDAQCNQAGHRGKPNEFGKLVQVQEAENQIITHYEVFDKRPSDQRLLVGAVKAQQQKLGRGPQTRGSRCRILFARKRAERSANGRGLCLDSQSQYPERGAAEITKEALVQSRAKVAHGL
jgi:IS5 family transposase